MRPVARFRTLLCFRCFRRMGGAQRYPSGRIVRNRCCGTIIMAVRIKLTVAFRLAMMGIAALHPPYGRATMTAVTHFGKRQ